MAIHPPVDARPVSADLGGPPERPIRFRRAFDVDDGLVSATLQITALGMYQAELNGVIVGDELLSPGWTSYHHRLRYQTFDVTGLMTTGDNALGVTVAEGWYRGRYGFEGGQREIYGDRIGTWARLTLDYGSRTDTIDSDPHWRAAHGPVLSASLYDGEHVDARLADDWGTPEFNDADWAPIEMLEPLDQVLFAAGSPPVRRIETLPVVDVITTPAGKIVLDFGQNISGWVRYTVTAPAGTTITVRHAEVLEHGELGTRPLRGAAATDVYVCRGDGPEIYEPTFTIHGFRYAEVTGWNGDIDPAAFEAVVVHTDMARRGTFSCSDDALNRLHSNVVWSMRDNFVDVPTDCPQRDERLGWTGDICVFASTAAFLYDCQSMLASWLADVAAEQIDLGTVPVYVPWIQLLFPAAPNAAWGDAAVVVPWVLYQQYGDVEILERQYPSMRAWVEQVASIAGDDHLWNTGMQLGDWLDPTAPPDRPGDAKTDGYLVATAYHAYTAGLLARTAEVLGHADDADRYRSLADAVTAAFNAEFVTPSGRMASDAQTAYALALEFDLLPTTAQRQRAAARLAELVRLNDFHIATGFVGTPLICDALANNGYLDDAYHLLTQTSCPSWLYPVTMGATTIWERWDSMLPDGSINPGDMTSFNHYALGAVAQFLHSTVAGLSPLEPGYRTFQVRPRPGAGLTNASATLTTPNGEAAVAWKRVDDQLIVDVIVPESCTAVVDIDGHPPQELATGIHQLTFDYRAATDDPVRPQPKSPFERALEAANS